MTTQASQVPVMHLFDAKRVAERNEARNEVRVTTRLTILFFGIFLMILALGVMASNEPHLATQTAIQVLILISIVSLGVTGWFGSLTIKYFMVIQDQQLSELRQIAANSRRPSWQELPPNS